MDNRQFVINITSNIDSKDYVPLMLLANILKGVQQTFYYFGLSVSKYEVKRRIRRIPLDIQKSCELFRAFEQKGSYELVTIVAEPEPQLSILGDIGLKARDGFLHFIRCLNELDDLEVLKDIVADSALRRTILRSIDSYCPKLGDEWYVRFGTSSNELIGSLVPNIREKISKLLVEPEVERRVVTGEIIRVHLDENRLSISYKPTNTILDCYYDPEIENFVIESLRDFIQVKGTVQLNEKGEPSKIVDVYEIIELDYRPLKISQASSNGITLKFKNPLEFEFFFNAKEQEICFANTDLKVYAYGETREDAIQDLEENLIWLWQEYGQAPDDTLSRDAIALKSKLNDLVQEVIEE